VRRQDRDRTTILYLLPHALGRSLRRRRTRPLGDQNNLHWTLDVTFNEDQSRLRTGHGAKNMAVVRHFALNLVRQVADKQSIKRRRKRAAGDPNFTESESRGVNSCRISFC
jgi:hypothetical protein